jgi:hypothetical protein
VVVDRPRAARTLTLFDTQAEIHAEIIRLRERGVSHVFALPPVKACGTRPAVAAGGAPACDIVPAYPGKRRRWRLDRGYARYGRHHDLGELFVLSKWRSAQGGCNYIKAEIIEHYTPIGSGSARCMTTHDHSRAGFIEPPNIHQLSDCGPEANEPSA